LSTRRRTLYYLHEIDALYSIEKLAEYLGKHPPGACVHILNHTGRNCADTKSILGQLEVQGYVKRAAATKKTREGNATDPLFTLIADDEMLENIFCPELEISHLVSQYWAFRRPPP